MRIITKYLRTTIITYILLVMFFLFGLQIFIEFINEFRNIGVGSYGLNQILIYVLFMLPYDIYLFFPMASLLGCIIALGLLASNSELIIMRASGMSLVNIATAVMKTAIILLIAMVLIGELLSPLALRKAASIKTAAISGGQALLTREGIWLNNSNSIINIKSLSNNGELHNITRYKLGNGLKLRAISYAQTGKHNGSNWEFSGVKQTEFTDTTIKSSTFDKQKWELTLSPRLIGATHIDTRQKNLGELYSYIKYRIKSGLNVSSYEFAFWQRIFAPLATLVMILLAIPFVFGPLRSATMGLRMLSGVMVGFGFYILYQFIGPMSIIYHIPPPLAAALPSLIFAAISGVLLLKVRQ